MATTGGSRAGLSFCSRAEAHPTGDYDSDEEDSKGGGADGTDAARRAAAVDSLVAGGAAGSPLAKKMRKGKGRRGRPKLTLAQIHKEFSRIIETKCKKMETISQRCKDKGIEEKTYEPLVDFLGRFYVNQYGKGKKAKQKCSQMLDALVIWSVKVCSVPWQGIH